MIGYDRLIENPNAFYITFDNKEVGRMRGARRLRCQAARATTPSSRDRPPIRTPTSCSPARWRCSKTHRRRQDQECRRGLYRRLAAGQRPEEHGAVPDQEQQQGRCGRGFERRHGRRRHRGACGAGHGRRSAGFRPGRRSCRAQPRRARHADRVGVEGRPRARQERRPRSPRCSPTARR